MADNRNITKAALDKKWLSAIKAGEWISATEVGENVEQSNSGASVLALFDIREACLGGCRAILELLDQDGQKTYAFPPSPQFWFAPNRLDWVCALNTALRREDFRDRSWPWGVRAFLSPSERWEFAAPLAREQESMVRVFLHRADAVRWGLLPAVTPPQVEPATTEPLAALPQPPQARPEPPTEQKPMEPADWFRNAIKDNPRRRGERTSDYATRLHELMKAAPVTWQWKYKTMYRSMYRRP